MHRSIIALLLLAFIQTTHATTMNCADLADKAQENACNDQTLKHADKELNENYQSLLSTLKLIDDPAIDKESMIEGLKQAERDWLKFRNNNCMFYSSLGGGTMSGSWYTRCTIRMARERAKELRGFENDFYHP